MALSDVAVVLRSFIGSPEKPIETPLVVERVRTLIEAGVGDIIVVIRNDVDKGITADFLRDFENDIQMLQVDDAQHGRWAPALNLGLMYALLESETQYVSFMSNEAGFTAGHLLQMREHLQSCDDLVVGTSFEGHISDGMEVSLGSSYRLPRNTGAMYSREAFRLVQQFEPLCDTLGGMEDVAYLARLWFAGGRKRHAMLNLQVPLLVGANYDQADKETRERAALAKIRDVLYAAYGGHALLDEVCKALFD